MKRYIVGYVLLLSAVLTGILVLVSRLEPLAPPEVDMVEANRIAYDVERNWNQWEKLNTYAYDFLVLDANGGSIFKTKPELPDTLHAATKACLIRMDIINMGYVMLDVGIQNDINKEIVDRRASVLTAGFAIIVIMSILLVTLYFNILHPFSKLRTFAAHVAAGHLNTTLPMDKGNIFGAFTESFDVMRQSLLESKQNELAATQSKKELIAALSHDIKTPVTSIRLMSELLQVQVTDAGQLEKLKSIESKTVQIDKLVSNLLGSTLEELGHFSVIPTDEDSAVLHELLLREDVQTPNIPRCLISIDIQRMTQVIANIVDNSRKYAGTSVAASFLLVDSFLQMDISDYGHGAPESELELLCTKFYRGTDAVNSAKQGEGLGLYIAKTLIEKMDGDLMCMTRPDGFTVRLLIKLS